MTRNMPVWARRLRSAVYLVLAWLSSAPFAPAETPAETAALAASLNVALSGSRTARTRDEIWLVSTRSLPGDCASVGCPPQALQFQRGDRCGPWQPSDWGGFLGSFSREADGITIVYVHGNRADWSESIQRGWMAYDSLTMPEPDGPPVRLIIWSWPSDQIRGQLDDVRVKAARTEFESRTLAEFLTQLPHETPLSLLGYSFGARIVSGALHELASKQPSAGEIVRPRRAPMRVVLVAAALNNQWLLAGQCHGRAFDLIDRMLVVMNSCDPVLKHYHLVECCRRGGPEALGFTGIPWVPPERSGTVEQLNAAGIVGRSHDEFLYFGSAGLFVPIRQYLFWREP